MLNPSASVPDPAIPPAVPEPGCSTAERMETAITRRPAPRRQPDGHWVERRGMPPLETKDIR